MITGTVNADYEAVIRLFVQGPTGPAHEIDAIIDTGPQWLSHAATCPGRSTRAHASQSWPRAVGQRQRGHDVFLVLD